MQKEPLKDKLDSTLSKRKNFSERDLQKYASLDKQALMERVAQLDWLMQGVSVALKLLSPFAAFLMVNPKLYQAYNLIAESVQEWERSQD
jgi:hypothetical protein